MKRFLILLPAIILAAFVLRAQETEKRGPEITFEKTVHDFGEIPFKGEPRTTEFKFTNTGDAPLVILRTQLSCTCLEAEYPRKPVAPGESGIIKVTYTAKKETGEFQNTVKVVTNSEIKTYTLFIDCTVLKK